MKTSPTLLSLLALLTLSGLSQASDYPAPFSLRFSSALSHYDVYGDTAAKGGASVSGRWGSSASPAPMAWGFQGGENEYILSAQYGNVSFDSGTHLNIVSEAFTVNGHELGVFRIALGQVSSNESVVNNLPLAYDFDAQLIRLEWSKRVSDSLSIGFKGGVLRSETDFSTHGLDIVNSKGDAWTLGLGALYKPATNWLIGMYGEYGFNPGTTTSIIPTATGLVSQRTGGTDHSFVLHPGVSYEFAKDALVHAEYQFGWFDNDTTNLHQNRFMVGTDIPLAEFFYLRAGTSIDARGNVSWTTGIGFYPSHHLTFDLAYQNDAFPELRQEFGRSRTLNASISYSW